MKIRSFLWIFQLGHIRAVAVGAGARRGLVEQHVFAVYRLDYLVTRTA